MIILSKEQVIRLHGEIVDDTGGSRGIRDDALLSSALSAPFHSFNRIDVYPNIHAKAARLCYGIIQNHPFIDGNKRTGTHVMLVFLALNGIELEYTQQELIDIIMSVAAGQANFEDLLTWVLAHDIH